MRCDICDVALSEQEIQLGKDKRWEPCTTCNQIIFDTAYSDGFSPEEYELVPEDLLEEEEEEIDGP